MAGKLSRPNNPRQECHKGASNSRDVGLELFLAPDSRNLEVLCLRVSDIMPFPRKSVIFKKESSRCKRMDVGRSEAW